MKTENLIIDTMCTQQCSRDVMRTLLHLRGVGHVDVSVDQRSAIVFFDDALTSLHEICASLRRKGFDADPVRRRPTL